MAETNKIKIIVVEDTELMLMPIIRNNNKIEIVSITTIESENKNNIYMNPTGMYQDSIFDKEKSEKEKQIKKAKNTFAKLKSKRKKKNK